MNAAHDHYGWWPFGQQRDDRSGLMERAEWAAEQIKRAEGGGKYPGGYFDAGTAIGEKSTPSSLQESPQSTGDAHVIVAWWLATAAQDGRSHGWSEAGIQNLISVARDHWAAGMDPASVVRSYFSNSSTSSISEIFTGASQELAGAAASQPPLKSYKSYLMKFQQMGDLDSIEFNKDIADASSIGVGEAIVGTAVGTGKDLLYGLGVGEGGALAAQAERDQLNREEQWRMRKPWVIGGGIVLVAAIGYWFLKPEK